MNYTVQLFVTCIIDTLFPEIGKSVVRILENQGIHVEFPREQTCCGQPAYNTGMRKEATQMAKHTIQVFEKTQGMIVIPSGSCTSMIKHGYLELFKDDESWYHRAFVLSERVYELSQFLVDVLGVVDLKAKFDGTIAYHPSCHLFRELKVDRQPRLLLLNVEGVNLKELPHAEECCGFGGVFSAEFPVISGAILNRKLDAIETSEADIVVTCDAGCLLHIQGGMKRKGCTCEVKHIAEVLDHATTL